MLHTISWHQFLVTLLGLLALYYLYVAVMYFRIEIVALIQKLRSKQIHTTIIKETAGDADDAFSLASHLSDDLKKAIREAGFQKTIKAELAFAIQQIVKNYYALKTTPFYASINNLIGNESMQSCGIQFTAEELGLLWK